MNQYRHHLLRAAAAAGMTLATTCPAYADVFAQSILVIDHFRLLHASGAPFHASEFGVLAGANDARATAQLNGQFANGAQSADILSGINPDVAHQSAGRPAGSTQENRFSNVPLLPIQRGTFAYADQYLAGSAIAVGGVPAGAYAATRADAALAGGGTASGNADLGTSTTFSFTVDVADSLTIAFDASPFTQAWIDDGAGANANARLSWSISLFDLSAGLTVLSYAPEALNGLSNVSRSSAAPGWSSYAPGTLQFSTSSGLLLPGNTYQITIQHNTLANALQARLLPEPGSLALAGLGLLALSAAGRRCRA